MITETHEEFSNILEKIFHKNGIDYLLSDSFVNTLYDFTNILLVENEKTNLTAIKNTCDVIVKHYADSLLTATLFENGKSVIDIGCGAGFPTIPLAIARQDLKITALDSTGKKIDFVNFACKKLGLSNVTGVCARAEEYVNNNSLRESYDYATARAVSRLNVLAELAIPFVKIGGEFISLKAKDWQTEILEAESGIATLGGKITEVKQIELFGEIESVGERTVIKIAKTAQTPASYPRAYAKITKKPL